ASPQCFEARRYRSVLRTTCHTQVQRTSPTPVANRPESEPAGSKRAASVVAQDVSRTDPDPPRGRSELARSDPIHTAQLSRSPGPSGFPRPAHGLDSRRGGIRSSTTRAALWTRASGWTRRADEAGDLL